MLAHRWMIISSTLNRPGFKLLSSVLSSLFNRNSSTMPLIKLGLLSLDKIKAKLMMATALYSNPLVRLILILYAKLFSFLTLSLTTKNPEATSLKPLTLLWTGSLTTAAPKSTTRGPFFSRMAKAKLKLMKSDFVTLSHESRNTTSS